MTVPHEGLRLGRYTLVRRLGAGGMGSVWEAVLHGPEGFARPVALKLLLDGRGPQDDSGRASLVREARIGALLAHPNVVGTHDLGEVDGTWYVAMELVRGMSLQEASKEGPLSPVAVLDVAAQTCAGLHHVHTLQVDGAPAGLVHRDLKPSNLLLDRTGLVKIADLGIARLAASPGAGVGTPGYLSEEQSEGREDHRSDLFSLGVTLFQLATGTMPFGSGVQALYRLTLAEDLLANGLCDAVDAAVPGLGPVVHRCLRRDPALRFPDARSLGDAVAELRERTTPGRGLAAVLGRSRTDPHPTPAPDDAGGPRTVAMAPGNLPAPRDPFFGRQREVREVGERIRAGDRLLVLKGPGGTGKTRLALAVARDVAADLPGGSWFVDLSEAVTAAGVCSAVAAAFQLPLDQKDPVRALGRSFAYRGRALFVLDNLEQVVDVLPDTLSRWLEQAPDATFLCTSRSPLRLVGERAIAVDPLSVQDGAELFLDRAPRPPRPSERAVVEQLVSALEGLPLAIELAAARTRLMPVRRIIERLTDRLRLLSDGDRDRPSRQRSLTASLDASWDLLPPWARVALEQLCVFEGGFTLDAAEAVLDLARFPEAPWAVDVLGELVDASLLRTDPAGDRFRMMLVVQEWARSRADVAGLDAAEARHGAHFAREGTEAAIASWSRHGGLARYRAVLPELDNVVAACRRATRRGDVQTAASTAAAAADWLVVRGPISTLVELATSVLALGSVPAASRRRLWSVLATAHLQTGRISDAAEAQARALEHAVAEGNAHAIAYLRGRVAWRLQLEGKPADALPVIERAVQDARADGSPEVVLVALREAGGAHWLAGRLTEARDAFEEAMPLARSLGDVRSEAFCTGNLGLVRAYLGDRRAAVPLLQRAREQLVALSDRRNEALILVNTGLVLHESGRLTDARADYVRAVDILSEVGDERARAIAACNLGYVLHELGESAEGHRWLTEALAGVRRAADVGTELLTLANLALMAWERGEAADALQSWTSILDRCREHGQNRTGSIVASQLAAAHLDLEDYVRAAALVEDGRAMALAAGLERTAWLDGLAARIGSAQGDESAPWTLRASVASLRQVDDLLWLPLQVQLAAIQIDLDPRDALRLLDEVVGVLTAGGYGVALAEARVHRALALRAAGLPGADEERALAEAILDRTGCGPDAPLRKLARRLG